MSNAPKSLQLDDPTLWEESFEVLQDPLVIVDHSFHIVRANSCFKNKLKMSSRYHSPHCYDYIHQQSKPCDNCPLLTPHSSPLTHELNLGLQTYRVNSYPLTSSSTNKYFIHHYKDVTQEGLYQTQMLYNQKRKILEEFSTELVSSLSNPLTLIEERLNQTFGENKSNDIEEILRGVHRAQNVLHQLVQFAHGSPLLTIEKIDPLISQTLPYFKSFKRNIDLQVNLSAPEIKVKVSPSLIQQVVFNLVNNAQQVIKDQGGRLTLQSRPFTFEDQLGVRVDVVDAGEGLSPELQKCLFKSPFTTKKSREGTGLGLQFCAHIIRSSGGVIGYEPAKPKGSHFWFWLPSTEK